MYIVHLPSKVALEEKHKIPKTAFPTYKDILLMRSFIKEFSSGFLIGIANIIPGVSGGTFLLILGMYQRVMSAISGLSLSVFKMLFQHCFGILFSNEKKTHLSSIKILIQKNDLFFLAKLVMGAVTAILVLSDLMMFLLTKQFSNTYAFFFGLILVSTFLSLHLLQKITVSRIFMLLLGILTTVAVTVAVNPAEKAKTKSNHYKSIYEQNLSNPLQSQESSGKKSILKYTHEYTLGEFAFGALSGAISVSAMVLPGISGSLVLILIGQYHRVINAISSLRSLQLDHILFLFFFAGGMIIGVLLFARLVTFVFKRFYNGTIAFLTGLMAGSLYTLWPFKGSIIIDQYVKEANGISLIHDAIIRTNVNVLPANAGECIWAMVVCGVGAVIMIFLGRYTEK